MNLNRVLIAGHLTRDVEARQISADRVVANFGVAVNHRYKAKEGEFKEETTFIDCEAWGRTAELCVQYLSKGRPVFIEGRLRLDTWEDKDGSKRSKLKVVADNVQFMGARGDGMKEPQAQAAAPVSHVTHRHIPAPAAGGAEDDVPFSRFEYPL